MDYELSKNQIQFVEDALEAGFEVDYDYSGRGMYGRCCPAVTIGRDDPPFFTKAVVARDSMGLDEVVYAKK